MRKKNPILLNSMYCKLQGFTFFFTPIKKNTTFQRIPTHMNTDLIHTHYISIFYFIS